MNQLKKFFESILVGDNCWEWISTKGHGYGIFIFNEQRYAAHRFSYILFNGEFPPHLLIRHKCGNPGCVNPDHLQPGTSKENTQDALAMGRMGRSLFDKAIARDILLLAACEIYTEEEIAECLRISVTLVNSIIRGKHPIFKLQNLLKKEARHHQQYPL